MTQFDVESIRRLRVEPGDTLVVKLGHVLTGEALGTFADAFRDQLPDDVKVMFVSGDVELEVIAAGAAADMRQEGQQFPAPSQ